nr:hypothetical protein [Microbacterium suwonense]
MQHLLGGGIRKGFAASAAANSSCVRAMTGVSTSKASWIIRRTRAHTATRSSDASQITLPLAM